MNTPAPRGVPATSEPPCIIMLSVGNSGSTVVAGLISILGWHLPDNDSKFNEPRWVRELNDHVRHGGEIDLESLKAKLAVLPRPWLLKDPRFCETLGSFLPALADYRPMLLFLERKRAALEASWLRRPLDTTEMLERRLANAESQFQNWPWAKTRVGFEDIANWAANIDLSRAVGE
jgi:hypothetical protein